MPAPLLDLVTARRWALTARALLGDARERIDALNVFPVADGDTGTNMYLTVDGALDFARSQHEAGAGTLHLGEGLNLLARGMLLSARGNSGVILSQLARGMAEAVTEDADDLGPQGLAEAVESAARAAWESLESPVEGTILSVARAAGEGARAAVEADPDGAAGVAPVAEAAAEAARQALARTPDQLPALRAAGVVDAGGAGLLLVLEALEAVLQDRPRVSVPELPDWWARPDAALLACAEEGGAPVQEGAVEVMYLLSGSDPDRVSRLRRHLGVLGDSVVVAGGPHEWRVHVHLVGPSRAVEAGVLAGTVTDVRVTSLVDGSPIGGAGMPLPEAGDQDPCAEGEEDGRGVAVVACALGDGLHHLFREAGAATVASGPGSRASAGQLLAAARAAPGRPVVILPNDADTVLVARAAAQEAGREGLEVSVIPTTDVLAGLAAATVVDPDAPLEVVRAAMSEAAGHVRSGALTRADRDALTPVGPCRVGQWLGLVDHEVAAVHDRLGPCAEALLDLLWTDEVEIVTVITGAGAATAPAEELESVLEDRAARHTLAEVVRLVGDQPTYPWLVGVE